MVSVNFAAAAAALGIVASASAGIVTVSQTFYNASFAARTFEYVQLMPTAGSSSGSNWVMNGSVSATLSDLNGNGGFFSSAGQPVYRATIDDVAVASLWSEPFTFALTGPYLSESVDPASFSNLAVPAGSNPEGVLGIVLRFTLSAGDAVTISGTFETVAVPAPGVASILVIAAGSGFGRRRRS